ncbi:MAG: hypothetical protein JXA57_16780, partial [Armatimonadetes bacterium]|nr:hypothetical protein [Armatimonadota bacterium]
MLFVLTVDTEGDDQWDHGRPLSTENARHWEPFQSLCERHGVAPTYLVTSEIVADPLAVERLRSWASQGRAEIGAHLHPWSTPPFADVAGFRQNDPDHAFLSELPVDAVGAKLRELTNQIHEAIGIRPASFRAGRFGFDLKCAQLLAELGYSVDSSVTPMIEWSRHRGLSGGQGGPDFRGFDTRPFIIAGTGQPGLLEIPVTILPTYRILERSSPALRLYRSVPMRALRRAGLARWLPSQPVWLRPYANSRQKDLSNVLSRQYEISDVAIMMLHSSELMPGGSPYCCDQEAVQRVLEILGELLIYAAEIGASFATLH